MSSDARSAVALLLGFSVDPAAPECRGFRINLLNIPALPTGFTIGDVLAAYTAKLLAIK